MQGMKTCSPQWNAFDRDRHLLLWQEARKADRFQASIARQASASWPSLQGWCGPRKLLRMGVKLRPSG